jgi:hydroxyacylglutathione hydrolase
MLPTIDAKKVRSLTEGDVLFREGDSGHEFFVVLSGAIEISRTGSNAPLARLGPGESFGEMAIIDGEVRSATATCAAAGTTVLAVDQAHFIYLVGQHPAFALAIMQGMSKRLRPQEQKNPEPAAPRPARAQVAQTVGDRVSPVAPGVFMISGGRASSNSYVFKGSAKTLLVDTGLPEDRNSLVACLAHIGLQPADIDIVVLTHEHIDHIGCISLFTGRSMIAAHRLAASKIRYGDEYTIQTLGFADGRDAFAIDLLLTENAVIDLGGLSLSVLHTPGHTSGGISLFERHNRVLVSGDLVMAGGHIGGVFASGNIGDYLQSLEILGDMQASALLPGHGPVSRDVAGDLARASANVRLLLAETTALSAVLAKRDEYARIVMNSRDINRLYR